MADPTPASAKPSAAASAAPTGGDQRLENFLFPSLQGWSRATALFLYYLAIILALMLIYGRGDFTTAPFIYQGF